jgi:hypothetical protein
MCGRLRVGKENLHVAGLGRCGMCSLAILEFGIADHGQRALSIDDGNPRSP